MSSSIEDKLNAALRADIQALHPADDSAIARAALRRLQAVADNGPAILVLLAEPWLQGSATKDIEAVLLRCARVHLYARILDDALDENLPVHRRNLLRVQPILWEAVQGIGACAAPQVAREAVRLVTETVNAVELDERRRTPLAWGAKNHHLLLAPLLLSGDGAGYRACRTGLSNVVALIQAGDEWRQGELEMPQQRQAALSFLCDCLKPCMLDLLAQYGWRGAAERLAWNARRLLDVLSA